MGTASRAVMRSKSNPVAAIFLGGLLAGIGDITFAFVFYRIKFGSTPMRILQSVAGGLIGRDAAIAGGMKTAVLGAICHFTVALCAAAVYVIACRALLTVRQAVVCGLLYGIVVYGVMNGLVLPLRGINTPAGLSLVIPAVIGHMILVGLPIALVTKKFSR